MNPKVLITGHPNSGTSFLCNLVVEMGFNAGDPALLKAADDHNPHGYWEHVPLQEYVRNLSGYGDWMHVTGGYPIMPLDFTREEKIRVAHLFLGANIEVFKDTGLPVMYRLFPHDSKYLIMLRNRDEIYKSGNYEARGIMLGKLCANVEAYQQLVSWMMREVDCLTLHYEDFTKDVDSWIFTVASFLNVKPNIAKLREIWKPR